MAMSRWLANRKTVLIFVLLSIIVVGTVIFCKENARSDGPKDAIKIPTEYCDLYYPSVWGDHIKILQTDNIVQFRAVIDGYGLQPLFDIHFNSDEGVFCGIISAEEGREVSVSQTTYPIVPEENWSQEQLEMLHEMQDGLHYLLSQMPIAVSETAPVLEEQPATEVQETLKSQPTDFVETASESAGLHENLQTDGDIEIKTPYGVLRYPGIWADYLRLDILEADVHRIAFYGNVDHHPEQHLFDVLIGPLPEGAMELYTENGKKISLDIVVALGELDQTWEENDSDIIYGMMDDINYLLHMAETMVPNP